MKGFLILVVLVVGTLIVGMTQVSTICQHFYEDAQAMEGLPAGQEAFAKLRQDDPAAFKAKYEAPFLQRLQICNAAFYLGGDEIFKTVGESTRELYLESPFVSNDDFAVLLHRLAKLREEREPNVYYVRLKEIQDHFPNCSFKTDLDNEVKLVKVRLNI